MSQLWSSQQHAWLGALGHTVYAQGGAALETAPETALKAVDAAPARARDTADRHAQRPAPARRAPPLPAQSAPAAASPLPRSASRLPDRLHFALIRASGCNPNAADAAAVIAQWPDSSALRGNPAAKRALWPQLRALRKPQAP